ncbi:hypothetical protein BCR35DRAFT_181006 [Leucosporidium creatinivorum]|uniref:Proteophosphoglycan ppg4 n=1 Tax=Leucosporidium creatinivorum TaxID=106004 RepID=A0A1Y2E5X0_9BASI|nr:hypothetical protein BCR35DRAFT_181006 [Leucosporidium creatinivorum]
MSLSSDSFGGDTAWIAPWTANVLAQVQNGTNPYDVILPTLTGVFYPSVQKGFRPQLWTLLGLFVVSALVILFGIILRISQGRFWLIHRVDSTVLIPNISLSYSVCALAYAAVGMVSIVDAVNISKGGDYPTHYVGLQGVWPAVLWLGMYSEIWATFAAYYIRRWGAFYEESRTKTAVATVLPFILPVIAIAPPAVFFTFGAQNFNSAIREFSSLRSTLVSYQQEWTPAAGLDVLNLATIIPPVAEMAAKVVDYGVWCRRGFLYSAVILLVTLFIYMLGAYLEISHLRKNASKLRRQAALSPTMRRNAPMSPVMDRKVADNLDEEWFAGVRRQASLLEWAARNRTWTAALISLMLLESSALALWYGLAPLNIRASSVQFQTIILVACYMNGILSTLVSLLILFRSLDGSNPAARRLQALFPWLPLPPAVGLRGQETTLAQKTAELRSTVYNAEKAKEESSGGLQLPQSPTPLWGSPLMVQLEMEEKEATYSSSSSSDQR